MSYDEVADIAQHKLDVESLRAVAQSLGHSVSNYLLGLDIGGGPGLHAPWLLEICKKAYIIDILPFGALYDGGFNVEVIEKFKRHSVPYYPERVEFHSVDAQELIYKDALFDFIFSVNAFEHIRDPRKAFHEMVRVTKPGGLILIQFDPLWHSAYGHHLWQLNFDPWDHLLMSDDEFKKAILAHGGTEEEVRVFEHDMNRRLSSEYFSLFRSPPNELFSASYFTCWSKTREEDPYASHQNYDKCLALGFRSDDLLTRGIQFVAVRA